MLTIKKKIYVSDTWGSSEYGKIKTMIYTLIKNHMIIQFWKDCHIGIVNKIISLVNTSKFDP